MQRFFFFFFTFFLCLDINASSHGLKEVSLSDYGSVDRQNVAQTLKVAISDIEGKRLVLPNEPLDLENVNIIGKKHFAISGNVSQPIFCKDFRIVDCGDFDISGLHIVGTKAKFATFYIVGDCERFQVHDCLFDSEKGNDGHYTFYGIHVITNSQNPNFGYHNSPRKFKIYNNKVKHTRYDAILAHAYCSDFVIENNQIVEPECIGVEIEGRLGGLKNTTVNPCKNAVVRNNDMLDCGDWGVLLMWADHVKVYNNRCKNSFGAFLSIGCTNLTVKNNIFEGRKKGFEISQEFYKVSNGINHHIIVKGNTIKARARAEQRGVLDIRHARNVKVKNNKITSIYCDNTAYVSLASCQGITIRKNSFSFDDQPLHELMYKTNVPSPETNRVVPELDLDNLSVQDIEVNSN